MRAFPNAKINLGLNVLRRREDGYHDIETLFVPYYGLRDELEITQSDSHGGSSIRVEGAFVDWEPETDLVWKACSMLTEEFGLPPVDIRLRKVIPAGAGLGGGSSDCAAALIMLDSMFSLHLGKPALASRAARLGSDCPFFIYNQPCFASGRGELLEPYDIDLDDFEIKVTVPPGVSVSTREAYAGLAPGLPKERLRSVLARPVPQWRGHLVNDFEPTVFAVHPELAAIKDELYGQGAVYAAMSGSGSAMLGLFRK